MRLQLMAHTVSGTASAITLRRGWRLLAGADRHRARELRIEAERCFRLAESTIGFGLAAELEAIRSPIRQRSRRAKRKDAGGSVRDLLSRLLSSATEDTSPSNTLRYGLGLADAQS